MKKSIAFLILAFATSFAGAQSVALVQKIQGTAYYVNDDKWEKLQLGQELGEHGQVYASDGNVVVALQSGQTIVAASGAQVVIRKVSGLRSEVQLVQGRAMVTVPSEDAKLLVCTPYGGVDCGRGQFVISAAEGVRSYNGTALIALRKEGQPYDLKTIHTAEMLKIYEPAGLPASQYAKQVPAAMPQAKVPVAVAGPKPRTLAEAKHAPARPPSRSLEEQEAFAYKYRIEKQTQDSTDRIKLSARQAVNVTSKFSGIGGSLNPSQATKGVYDNGYVHNDSSGSKDGQTWNWGYQNPNGQVNMDNNTIAMDRLAADPKGSGGDNQMSSTGFELQYNHDLIIEPKYHIGFELAANYVPFSIEKDSRYGATMKTNTDYYSFTPGTTPPGYNPGGSSGPYSGTFGGPGFMIGNSPSGHGSSIADSNAIVSQHDSFKADLIGMRLGPTLTYYIGKEHNLTLDVSGGLALGYLHVNESWSQTVNSSVFSSGSQTAHGGGTDNAILVGGYFGLGADYRFADHWGVSGGVQYQNLGTYSKSFQGHNVSLDLSKSIFFTLGLSYDF